MPPNLRSLLERVLTGNCTLFLGAGASATSKLRNGDRAPIGNKLAELVYKHFYPDVQYDNESLAYTSNIVSKAFGQDKLKDFLFSYLKDISPSLGLQNLTKFRWRNIYTTNIETAIERSYELCDERAQDVKVVVGPMDTSIQDNQTEVTLYKLHGCINRSDVGLVFSLEEYANTKENHLKLFNCLSNDLIESNVIFIGYSMLDSNFQETWSTIKKYCNTTQAPNKYYFVSPYLKSPSIDFLKSEGFEVFNIGVDEFAEQLVLQSRNERKTLNEYYNENIKPISLFGKINLSPEYKYRLSKNYDFPSIEVNSSLLKTTALYKGNLPSWADIKFNLDAGRDLFETLMRRFSEWIESPDTNLWLITGRAGDGKSMLLRRLAYEISLKVGETVLYAKSRAELEPEEIIELSKQLKLPLIIFIDDTTDRLYKVNRLISFIKSARLKVLIIGCSRTSDWSIVNKDFFIKPIEFNLPRLSDNEIKNILLKLQEHSALGHLGELNERERISFFKEKAERELLVALKEATLNKNFDEIIANEFSNIKSQDAQNAYLLVCLVYQFRYRIPQSLLVRILEYDISDIREKIFKFTEDIIFFDETPTNSDFLLRARHSVIAQTVVDYYLKGDVEKFDVLEKILNYHTPSNPLEKSLVKKIYHHTTVRRLFNDIQIGEQCYEMLSKEVPGDYYILQQKAIFLSDYKKDFKGAKEAIVNARHVSEEYYDAPTFILENTEGTILLNEALQTDDYVNSKFLMEKGKRIIMSIIRGSFKNNAYNYHSLINHMIAWYEKFNKEDAAVLEEIQKIIDEALKRSPNDHMILTECGKLESILNHTVGAIQYYRQAILINPRNSSARYLLVRSLFNKGELKEALEICEEGMNVSLDNQILNKTRFEVLHKLNNDKNALKKYYEDYLRKVPADLNIKLLFAAYLYVNGDNLCDKIFSQIRNSRSIPIDERYYPHSWIAKFLNEKEFYETGKIDKVTPTGYYINSTRFSTRTLAFLHGKRRRTTQTTFSYKYTFNFYGPYIVEVEV